MGTDLPNPGSSVLPSQDVTYESVAGSLFPHTPTITDEHQGEFGDCYFISSLGTIASSNPAAIENMIINNGDGTYTVRFYTGTYGGSTNSDGSYSDGFQRHRHGRLRDRQQHASHVRRGAVLRRLRRQPYQCQQPAVDPAAGKGLRPVE